MSKSKILVAVTGSISAYKAAMLCSTLVQNGHQAKCLMTESAKKFIGTATLEGITGQHVADDLWAEGHMMEHIHLTREYDQLIIYPASANTIAHIAHGLAGNLVTSLCLAWPKTKKKLLAPAMNTNMLENPATQENLVSLKNNGWIVFPTNSGHLACGETADGRLVEPNEVMSFLKANRPKIIITSGPTMEKIDGARVITNISTGETGAHIADSLMQSFDVTYLHGKNARLPKGSCETRTFESHQDLSTLLKELLSSDSYDYVIHCAAVSDYTCKESKKKISSGAKNLTLELIPTEKIVKNLKQWSKNKFLKVVAFKFTDKDMSFDDLNSHFGESVVDTVIYNTISDYESSHSNRSFKIINERVTDQASGIAELSSALKNRIETEVL
jgi:phosphopantothenoylcysteine decarboxylase/phosphopantothenate--cysteine ligase